MRLDSATRNAALFGVTLFAIAGPAAAAPFIVGDAKDVRCREALEMATESFNSNSSSLLWPIANPPRPGTRTILRQSLEDISGGHALQADVAEFTTLQQAVTQWYSVTTYWGTNVSAGKRLVVVDSPAGWKGDNYAVYLLDPDKPPEFLIKQLNFERPREAIQEPALGERRWNPPIVLTDNARGYWLIDRGEPYEAMPDWAVYLITSNGLTTPCRISFGYAAHERRRRIWGVSSAADRMPPAVHNLAAALDEALGPGENEGTLQSTAGIRIEVKKWWANAALRPWAVRETPYRPYNTRAQVDQGLADWSRGSARRTALRRRIEILYPVAERALASYYAARFKTQPKTARQLSRQVLDRVFRSYFVFPGGRTQ